MSFQKIFSLDPYRLLFPIGIIHSLVGVVYWIFFIIFQTSYPINLHAHTMISGFLVSFVLGFLMTAIPRFTGGVKCKTWELLLATLFSVLAFYPIPYLPALLSFLLILVFGIPRILKRSYNPPPHFIFLPVGIFLGITGALMGLRGYETQARFLLFYNVLPFFIMGVGGKLVTALLGWGLPPLHQIQSKITDSQKPNWHELKIPIFQVLLFSTGVFVEIFEYFALGRGLQTLVISWLALQYWHIFSLPKAQGYMAKALWLSCWFFVIGYWLRVFIPGLSTHGAHLIFISGMGLMTLMVGSRVVIAHGGFGLQMESQSRRYLFIAGLIIAAALIRVSISLGMPFEKGLLWSALFWISGLITWGAVFLKQIIRTK